MIIEVDPKLHTGINNIVMNTIVALFSVFQSKRHEFDLHDRNNILKAFQIIYHDLEYILYYGSKDECTIERFSDQHAIEKLSRMASACKLRDHLISLKELLEKEFIEIHLTIADYDPIDPHFKKYIKGVFKYTLI